MERAITRLLLHLKATDASLLNPRQRKWLYRFLRSDTLYSSSNFKIAILHALEQIGDEDALPCVQGVVNARDRKVRSAAQECLSSLQQRLQGTEQTLLRSSSDDSTASALLRPSETSPETDPQTLLRANTPEVTRIEDL
jgi:hypothetical protein